MTQTRQLNIDTEFLTIRDQLESYLYRLSANREDAKDLVQDTYIKVKERYESFQGLSSFKTWVFAIATNLARDNQRVRNRWKLEVQDECKHASLSTPDYQQRIIKAFNSQPEQVFEMAEHINYCFTCIGKNLKLEQQIALILKEFYAFKRTEIAAILEISEGVVKHLLFEGRKELQTRYKKRCALINKTGVCYQCAELNDFLQEIPDSDHKTKSFGLSEEKSDEENLDIRFNLLRSINPLTGVAANLEDTIMQILREVIDDK